MSPLKNIPRAQLEIMKAAGLEALNCQRVLAKTSTNTVAEVLAGQGTFYEYNHYPKGDVYDQESHAQYYYHSHRTDAEEHGHFHGFLRHKGIPEGIRPAPYDGDAERPLGEDALCHIVAVSMDSYGFANSMFTTNRWVTDETWYAAADVVAMIDFFAIDHTYPNWAVNRWLTAMFKLFRPQIVALIEDRDEVVARWRAEHPGTDVYEDRELEVITTMPISVDGQMAAIAEALA